MLFSHIFVGFKQDASLAKAPLAEDGFLQLRGAGCLAAGGIRTIDLTTACAFTLAFCSPWFSDQCPFSGLLSHGRT